MYVEEVYFQYQFIFNFFQIASLRDDCESFMISAICMENCVEVYSFADFQNLERLKYIALKQILENFSSLCEQDAFLKISAGNMQAILSSDNLNIANEELVYEAVLRWINYDPVNRKDELTSLLFCVRFPLMDTDYIEDNLCTEPLILDNDLCRELVEEARNLDTDFDDVNTSVTQFNLTPRLGMYYKKMLVFSADSLSSKHRSFGCFDPETDQNFYSIKPHRTRNPMRKSFDQYKLVVTEKNEIYFLGSVSHNDLDNPYAMKENGHSPTFLVFNQMSSRWEERPPMMNAACSFGACYYSGKIYVFGGILEETHNEEEPLNTVHAYDIEEEEWNPCNNMPMAISHHAVAVYRDKAYIFGGFNARKDVLSFVLQYHFHSDQWSMPNTSIPIPQAESTAITHKNNIYILGGVLGGRLGSGNNLTVCIFDPEKLKWRYGEEFPDDRKFTSVTKGDGYIYVCGGTRKLFSRTREYSNTSEIKDLFQYDISANSWSMKAHSVEYGSSYTCAFASVNSKYLKGNLSTYSD